MSPGTSGRTGKRLAVGRLVVHMTTRGGPMTTDLFAPYRLGELELTNRFVMAPPSTTGSAQAPA